MRVPTSGFQYLGSTSVCTSLQNYLYRNCFTITYYGNLSLKKIFRTHHIRSRWRVFLALTITVRRSSLVEILDTSWSFAYFNLISNPWIIFSNCLKITVPYRSVPPIENHERGTMVHGTWYMACGVRCSVFDVRYGTWLPAASVAARVVLGSQVRPAFTYRGGRASNCWPWRGKFYPPIQHFGWLKQNEDRNCIDLESQASIDFSSSFFFLGYQTSFSYGELIEGVKHKKNTVLLSMMDRSSDFFPELWKLLSNLFRLQTVDVIVIQLLSITNYNRNGIW